MDAFSNPFIERIVFNKGSQLGGTEALYNMLGYAIHQDPAPCLFVMPTLELAKFASRSRIQPMIEACESLKRLKPSNDDDYTTYSMTFPGMVLALAGANSPASLASRPCRYVFLDEVNKFPQFAGKEADPISLASERQKTFWNRKTVVISTPTTEDGQISREIASCDVVYEYRVPCPHCGASQSLKWPQVKWDKGLDRDSATYSTDVRDSAWYECEGCKGRINDIHRPRMISGGRWTPSSRVESPRSVGFTLSSLYSSWLTWGDVAEQFVKSHKFPEKLMNFVNSWLAEPWVNRIQSVDAGGVLEAKTELKPMTVPADAVALTAFIDVQRYSFWFSVRAWARDYTSWLIHYGNLPGWDDVEALLFETAYPQDGAKQDMPIWRAGLDTGGSDQDSGLSMTEEAYFWLRRNGRGRGCPVWGTKGSAQTLAGKLQLSKVLDKTPRGKPLPGGLQIVIMDVSKLKDAFHYRLELARQREPGGAYLHSGVDELYARHITAEEKRRDERGREEWVRIRPRNDLLDCEVGCLALADPEWPGGGINLFRRPVARLVGAEQEVGTRSSKHDRSKWLKPAKSNWLGR